MPVSLKAYANPSANPHMCFISHGPVLPRLLLTAADAGDVVFVCGAGVSLAPAGSPTFQGLRDGVVNRLRPAIDGLAARVLAAEAQLRAADFPTNCRHAFPVLPRPTGYTVFWRRNSAGRRWSALSPPFYDLWRRWSGYHRRNRVERKMHCV